MSDPLRLLPNGAIARLVVSTPEEVIRALAARLSASGHVTGSFADAAVRREEQHPTGLPTMIPTAIPHTDPEHVITPGIAVAALETPVVFGEMGPGGSEVACRLVVMLALKDSGSQLSALQQLVSRLQDEDGVRPVLSAADDIDLEARVGRWLNG